KLPPPMTTHTSVPARATSAIWRATFSTTLGSTPTEPPPNISPPSFSITRRKPVRASFSVVSVMTLPSVRGNRLSQMVHAQGGGPRTDGGPGPAPALSRRPLVLADLEAGEAGQRDAGLVHQLLDGLLGVGDGRLIQEDDVLEEAV